MIKLFFSALLVFSALSIQASPSYEYVIYDVPSGQTSYTNGSALSYSDTALSTGKHVFGVRGDTASASLYNRGSITITGTFSGLTSDDISERSYLGMSTSDADLYNYGQINLSSNFSGIYLSDNAEFYDTSSVGLYTSSGSGNSILNAGSITISDSYRGFTLSESGDYEGLISTSGIIGLTGTFGSILNSGTIGISSTYTDNNLTFDPITVRYVGGIISNSATADSIINSGSISYSLISTGNESSGIYVRELFGIMFDASSITNSGLISLSVSDYDNNYDGDVRVHVSDVMLRDIIGIYDELNDNQTIANSGSIDMDISTDSEAYINDIYGIYSVDANTSDVTNTGDISISVSAVGENSDDQRGIFYSSETANVAGISILSSGSGIVRNSGDISVSAEAGSSANMENISAISVKYVPNLTLTNSGNINLDIKGGSSFDNIAAYILSDVTSAEITDSGNILISADSADSSARTLILKSSSAVLKDAFTVSAGSCPGCEDVGTIYVDSSSSLNLNSASLGVTLSKYISFNTPYTVIENDGGTVTGTFSGLRPFTNPDFTVNWYDGERGENSKVSVSYNPSRSSAGISSTSAISTAKAVGKIFNGSMLAGGMGGGLSGFSYLNQNNMLLADSGEIATDAGLSYAPKKKLTTIFAFPFITKMNGDGYDADTFGLGVGISHEFRSGISGSFYLGSMTTNIDFDDVSMDKTQSDSFFAGATAKTNKDIFVSASVIGFLTDNDYSGYTGGYNDLSETADYDSKGFQTEALGGYSFRFGKTGKVTPFGGMALSYYNMSSYNTEIEGTAYDYLSKDYETYSDWDTSLIMGLSTEYVTAVKAGMLKFYGEYRLENALGNNDITIGQSIPEMNTGTIEIDQEVDNTTHSLSLGTELAGSFWSTGVFGQYITNTDYDSFSLKLTAGLKF